MRTWILKGVLISSALTLAIFAAGQSPTRIALPPRTLTLREAIEAICRDSGTNLTVEDQLANEPLVLHLRSATLPDVMQRLAHVMGAEWVRSKDGQRLMRTPKILERLRRDQNSWRAAVIQEELRSLEKARKENSVLDDSRAREMANEYLEMFRQQRLKFPILEKRGELRRETAEARLLQDVLSAIGSKRLAAVDDNHRTVFAVNPTKAQVLIPRISADRLKQFADEHNALASALLKIETNARREGLLFTGLERVSTILDKPPVRVLLIVQPTFGRLGCEMALYDEGGARVALYDWHAVAGERSAKLAGLSKYSISEEESESEDEEREREGMPSTADKPESKEEREEEDKERKHLEPSRERSESELKALSGVRIRVGPELTSISARTRGGLGEKPLDQQTLEFLIRPDLHDPLDLGFAQGVLGIAEPEKLNVVATMADECFYVALRDCSRGEINPSAFLSDMESCGQEIVAKDGWLLAWPRDYWSATANRVDRKALATFLRSTLEKGATTIDDWGQVADTTSGDPSATLLLYRGLLVPHAIDPGRVNIRACHLLTALGQRYAELLKDGGAIKYTSLDKQQQSALEALVFGSSYLQAGKSLAALDEEPTEQFPDGIPSSAVLFIKDSFDEQFLANEVASPSIVQRSPISWDELATQIAKTRRPDLFARAIPVNSIRVVEKRTIAIRLEASETTLMERVLVELRPMTGGAIDAASLKDRVSAPTWQKIEARIQELLQYYKEHEQEIRGSRPKTTPP